MEDTKTWWQSRTVWVNIVATVFALLAAFKLAPAGLDQEAVVTSIMALVGVVNVVLRLITTHKIA